MKSRAYAMLGSKRRIVPTCRTSPEAVTAEASASHSSTLTPIGVADVLAVHLAEELAGVLRLNALRLVDRAGRRRVVLGPAQLGGRQAASRRVRAGDSRRGRRLGGLRHPGVVVDRDVRDVGALVIAEPRVKRQLDPGDLRALGGGYRRGIRGVNAGVADLETVRCARRDEVLSAPRRGAGAALDTARITVVDVNYAHGGVVDEDVPAQGAGEAVARREQIIGAEVRDLRERQ